MPTNAVIPIATKLPNISGALMAIKIPLHIKIANKIKTATQPINPNSSPKMEKMKSLCGSGMYKNFCLLSPNPAPNSPPRTGLHINFELPAIHLLWHLAMDLKR